MSSNSISAGLSSITIQWNVSDPFETNLERIIIQKWIAIYPDGQEVWTEFRRIRYPKIFPVVVNNSGGTIIMADETMEEQNYGGIKKFNKK